MKFINKIFPLFATTLLILNSTSNVLALSGDRNENVHEEQKNEVPISQNEENEPKDLVEVEIPEGKGVEDTKEEETSYETQTHGTWGGVDWMFTGTNSLWLTTSGKLGDMSQAPWNDPKTGIKPEDIQSVKIVTSVSTGIDARKLFSLPNVTEITGLEKLDTRATTQMSYMFAGIRVSELDLSSFNTSKVTTMTHMFDGAKELRKLNLSSFDTNKSPFMDGMFTGTTLTHLTLGNNFRFRKDADLGSPMSQVGEETTGNWVRDDYQTKGYSPIDFMTNYGLGELTAGTYIADRLRWGSSLWTFNEDTGTLTLESGQLGEFNSSDNPAPWKRTDENVISADKIRKIVLNGKVTAPQSSHQLFANLQNLEEIVDLQNLDTSMVNNMYSMFAGDTRLASLDLSHFETSNVSRMSSMFKNTSSLTQLDLSAFNTDKVSDMSNMFEETSSLTSLNLSNFNTSNVTTMQNMFYKATNLTSLNLGSFDTSNVENMAMMFKDMNKLNTLTLGNKFKFKNNSSLGAPAPVNIGDGSTGRWIRDDYQTKAYSPIDFMTNYGLGELTAGTYITERLRWGTAPWIFDESTGVLTVEGGELGESGTTPWEREDEYRIEDDDIKKIVFTEPVEAPQNSERLFSYLRSLEEIDGLPLLDTSKVTNMKLMFSNLPLLEQLDIEHFNTSSVTSMDSMFEGAESVISLNLNNWDVSKVESIAGMFAATVALQNLQVSNWDTHNVKNMESLFYYAMSLKELDLTNWNTLNVEEGEMPRMFGYVKLKRLTLGDSFKFQKGTELSKPSPLHQGDITTGKWIREDGASEAYTPEEFTSNYGTGDLKAGAYIAEATAKANLVVDFEAHPKDDIVNNTVGKTSEISLNIFNNGAQNSSETQVTLDKYDTQFETTSSEVQLSYLDKDDNETRKQTIPAADFKEGFVFDEKLGYNEKIKVSFEGIPWNNSPEETKDMDQVTISYHNGSKNTQASWTGTTFIANGTFGFKTVPEPLSFKKTPLSLDLNGKKIEREQENWGLQIEDFRGTNANDIESNQRADWELTASVAEFIDSENRPVSSDVLSLIYVTNQNTQELNHQEISLLQHSVKGETPKDNHNIVLTWGSNEGFMAQVHQRNLLRTNSEYKAQLDLDLRLAP